ncbi:unnamed protein product [Schistosoma rodhaini]|uniref:Uncharacterized protein n=1 Tax=Schistosoma rodhaini TaxID=6188 RepID=A0AA85FNX5_9TREM|nr:unnamed protein product [Schistosoma rodhaini]
MKYWAPVKGFGAFCRLRRALTKSESLPPILHTTRSGAHSYWLNIISKRLGQRLAVGRPEDELRQIFPGKYVVLRYEGVQID